MGRQEVGRGEDVRRRRSGGGRWRRGAGRPSSSATRGCEASPSMTRTTSDPSPPCRSEPRARGKIRTKWFGRRRREVKMRKEKRKSRGRLFLGSQEACAGRRRIKKLLLSQNWTAFLKQRLLQRKMSLLLQKRKLLPRRRLGRCNGGTPWPACGGQGGGQGGGEAEAQVLHRGGQEVRGEEE